MEEDRVVATFKLRGYEPGMRTQANPDLIIDLAVQEKPPPCADNDRLDARLDTMIKAVSWVLRMFEQSLMDEKVKLPSSTKSKRKKPSDLTL